MTRHTTTRRTLAAAALAAAATLLTACGGGDPAPTAATTPSAVPAAATTTAAPTTTTSTVAATTTTSAPAATTTTSSAACGVDLAAPAVADAVAALPTEPVTGAPWSSTAIEGNYDPCATLSTALVTVQGGTGSSPVQALMFHDGTYLGTGTSKAYGFTSFDGAATTDDTVVLQYKTPGSCNACSDGTVSTVRYQWDGTRVEMLDPAPPTS